MKRARQTLNKPSGLGPEYAAQFADPSIVDAYHHRPPHAEQAIRKLVTLIPTQCARILDIGCGTGDIARALALRGVSVDAVDASEAMITKGRTLPGGNERNLRWIQGRMEDVALFPPYGLAVAGESLHWMDWDVVIPRLHDLLHGDGYLVIVDRHTSTPWGTSLFPIINRYSTNRDYQPYDLVKELEERGHFRAVGTHRTFPVVFYQHIDSFVESLHSRNGLSRDRMEPDQARAFDYEVRELTAPWRDSGMLKLEISTSIIWGQPLRSS